MFVWVDWAEMGELQICDASLEKRSYHQGILIPQSKNFNSLDNIFTEYSEILYLGLGGLKLNRYGNV